MPWRQKSSRAPCDTAAPSRLKPKNGSERSWKNCERSFSTLARMSSNASMGVPSGFVSDFTEDLKALDVPIFIAHGSDDQIVPIAAAALKTVELVKHGRLKVYEGAPHGIFGAYQEELDRDILAFIAG